LAVTPATRSEALPDVATVSEFVPGYEASQWYGVGVPKNTPADGGRGSSCAMPADVTATRRPAERALRVMSFIADHSK